jgi:hypothetical protein
MSESPDGLPGVPLDPNIERLRTALAAYDDWPPRGWQTSSAVIYAARTVLIAYDEHIAALRLAMSQPRISGDEALAQFGTSIRRVLNPDDIEELIGAFENDQRRQRGRETLGP